MKFSMQEYWSGLPLPSPGDLPNPRIEPGSPALQADSLPTELWRKPSAYNSVTLPLAKMKPTGSRLSTTDWDMWHSSLCSVAQSCQTVCDPMDCILPGSSVHRILQARILEWVAISFSRGSSWPRDRTLVFCITGRLFSIWILSLHVCRSVISLASIKG